MRILCLGDIVGRPGRDAVIAGLFRLRRELEIDVVVANGENASGGLGITVKAASQLLSCGVDVITSGNHVFKHREILPFFETTDRLLRPGNYPPGTPGGGLGVYRLEGTPPFAVMNLLGRTYMDNLDCPFRVADEIIGRIPGDVAVRLLDLHAEATSEKKAMAYYLDGRISALCGTHTHVQTNDAQILPYGTAYITDMGMSGCVHSAIGMDPQAVIRRYVTGMPQRFVLARGPVELQGVLLDIDAGTGKTVHIQTWRHACQG
ncbi:TIGR00282 family metallophosphoesterase [Desulfolutivibrio sulfoxidireducens]|uniref:TIGR00282 family metallophosphoesterase n=1 Tax=Desulfolutivibrio sulfoxidireducens TaxID=2773299 RepID=UPI00159E380B|nr:TIGR00282 family metallophosphoesterase [Desulfolutivibrio sulfoxidireducens]QLA18759.1 metallophosphoesterase [Desulfolutivibrio sulfoxidireducens]